MLIKGIDPQLRVPFVIKSFFMNYKRVFEVFEKHYNLVPLEIFGADPYKTLISTILSARTNDDITVIQAQKLFDKAPDIYVLASLPESKIKELIYPVAFSKTKARLLKKTATIIINKYEGKVPNTQKELVGLPGVGKKTANLVLNRAFGIPAIAVDTHVHRITNMLGWVQTKTPEQTEKRLTKTVPKRYWADMNRLFVSIGRQFRSKRQLEIFLGENKLI
jgi:endonuclease-3